MLRLSSLRIDGCFDSFHDPHVGTATADVALHGANDLIARWMRILPQQAHGRHDHAGRTVRTLEHVDVETGLLNGVQLAICFESFDGCDCLSRKRIYFRYA